MEGQAEDIEKKRPPRKFFTVDDKDGTKEEFKKLKARIVAKFPMLDKMPDSFFLKMAINCLNNSSDKDFGKIVNL